MVSMQHSVVSHNTFKNTHFFMIIRINMCDIITVTHEVARLAQDTSSTSQTFLTLKRQYKRIVIRLKIISHTSHWGGGGEGGWVGCSFQGNTKLFVCYITEFRQDESWFKFSYIIWNA